MFSKSGFTFNGISSDTYNCFIGTLGSSGDESFGVGGIELIEEDTGNEIRDFYKVQRTPLTFSLTIMSEDEWTLEKRKTIASWLLQDSYKPLISDDEPTVIYDCICIDSPQKILIGNTMHGIDLTFRCNSPYGHLEEVVSEYTVTSTPLSITIDTTLSNYDQYITEVEIEFTLTGSNTDISIKNVSDSNKTLTFEDLTALETVYINNGKRKEILSSLDLERSSNSNLLWFRLVPNTVNEITITGECNIEFRYKLPVIG